MQDLHSKAGIAHLDLTSSNVMLCANGGLWDHIRLIDFGFAQTCKSSKSVITSITMFVCEAKVASKYCGLLAVSAIQFAHAEL